MRLCPTALIALLVVLPLGVGRSAIVKCRDAAGHWHYGDASGSTCEGRPHYLLNTQGLEIAAPAATTTKTVHPNQQVDQRLLATYGSLSDLQQAQARALTGLKAQSAGIGETLSILQRTLARMESLAALSRHPPPDLQQNIADTTRQIHDQQQALDAVNSQITTARAHYAHLIKRYQALPQATVTP